MRLIEKACLVVGSTSAVLALIGVATDLATLSYASVFLGRLAALLFSISIDRPRPSYFLPITLSLINVWVVSERLLFTELFIQSCVYQVSAFRLFNGRQLLNKEL